MPLYTEQQIEKAREMDLLTYLQRYEPGSLIKSATGEYCTREHDSLKISHGKWIWWSHGIGGASALDYLIKVKNIPFRIAVGMVLGSETKESPFFYARNQKSPLSNQAKRLLLPDRSPNNDVILRYLMDRGIDRQILDHCIQRELLYESLPHHDCIFVGYDPEGTARYAFFRMTGRDRIMGDASGSDKHFSFRVAGKSSRVHVFESAIDALSYGTILKLLGHPWNKDTLLSLGGVYASIVAPASRRLPAALINFLESRSDIDEIALHLDTDQAGRSASESIKLQLEGSYHIRDEPPTYGKDCNDTLLYLRRLERQNGGMIR